MQSPRVRDIRWDEICRAAKSLSTVMESLNWPRNELWTVARGGLIPAALLMQTKYFAAATPRIVEVKTYVGQNAGASKVKLPEGFSAIPEFSLLIDDLVDGGHTMEALQAHCVDPGKIFVGTLYAKPDGLRRMRALPFKYVYTELVTQNCWLNFPWEFTNVSAS